MSDTDLPPLQRITRRTKTDNIESDTSSPLMNSNNSNLHNPSAGTSQSVSIAPLPSRLSRYPPAPLPQGDAFIVVPVHLCTWNFSNGTSVLINQVGWVYRVTLEARDGFQNPSIYAVASWFDMSEVLKLPLIQSCAHQGILHGGSPPDVVLSRDRRGRIALDPNLLKIYFCSGGNLDTA